MDVYSILAHDKHSYVMASQLHIENGLNKMILASKKLLQ